MAADRQIEIRGFSALLSRHSVNVNIRGSEIEEQTNKTGRLKGQQHGREEHEADYNHLWWENPAQERPLFLPLPSYIPARLARSTSAVVNWVRPRYGEDRKEVRGGETEGDSGRVRIGRR